jgi:carboxymethylenebutenolidase
MEVVSEQVTVHSGSDRIPCHLARPATGGPFPAIVVVMEAFGLNHHISSITDRFASEGFVAISPNLYFRQPNNVVGYDDLQNAIRLMTTLNDDQIVKDMTGTIDYLKSRSDVKKSSVGAVGFCMGGRIVFLTACSNPDIKAVVPYYGGGMVKPMQFQANVEPPIKRVKGLNARVLAFFGGKDQFIPITEVDAFRDALMQAGKSADVVLYADADHGFMCDERPSHHPTHAKEAWAKTIHFFKTNLG